MKFEFDQCRPSSQSRFLMLSLTLCMALTAERLWADTENWLSLTTRYTTLLFQSEKDLEKFDRKIDYSPGQGFGAFFGGSGAKDLRTQTGQKIDLLYKRVQEILDMRKIARRVQIRIYGSSEKLRAAYRQEFLGHEDFRAWYVFEINTIYLQVNDIHEGMLAHEMAHAIIDNFLQVRPPAATAEILARYVDTHLHD